MPLRDVLKYLNCFGWRSRRVQIRCHESGDHGARYKIEFPDIFWQISEKETLRRELFSSMHQIDIKDISGNIIVPSKKVWQQAHHILESHDGFHLLYNIITDRVVTHIQSNPMSLIDVVMAADPEFHDHWLRFYDDNAQEFYLHEGRRQLTKGLNGSIFFHSDLAVEDIKFRLYLGFERERSVELIRALLSFSIIHTQPFSFKFSDAAGWSDANDALVLYFADLASAIEARDYLLSMVRDLIMDKSPGLSMPGLEGSQCCISIAPELKQGTKIRRSVVPKASWNSNMTVLMLNALVLMHRYFPPYMKTADNYCKLVAIGIMDLDLQPQHYASPVRVNTII